MSEKREGKKEHGHETDDSFEDKDHETIDVSSDIKKSAGKNDDNLIAAIAHILLFFVPFVGPIIIWAIYKDKSKYVKFQSMQAAIFQLIVTVVMAGLSIMSIFLTAFTGCCGIIIVPLMIIIGLACAGYGIYAAYMAFKGEKFNYLVIGELVEKNL